MGNAEWQTWMILANFGYALRGHLLQAMAEQRAVPDGATTASMEGREREEDVGRQAAGSVRGRESGAKGSCQGGLGEGSTLKSALTTCYNPNPRRPGWAKQLSTQRPTLQSLIATASRPTNSLCRRIEAVLPASVQIYIRRACVAQVPSATDVP